MKKYLWGIAVLFSSVAINAQPTPINEVKVNCDDVKLSMNTGRNNRFNFTAYWNDVPNFPNPPKSTEIGDSVRSKINQFNFTCPEFSVNYDGNTAIIKASNYNKLINLIAEYDREIELYSYSWYKYPNIKEGLMYVDYSINIEKYNLKSGTYKLKEGEDLNKRIGRHDIPKEAIIGYKVNNGSLKPILHNRQISYYLDDLKNASVIDIYHKYENDPFRVGASIQRIHIDKENSILKIYRKHAFPTD